MAVMKLVEVVRGPHVSDETAQISLALCERSRYIRGWYGEKTGKVRHDYPAKKWRGNWATGQSIK